MLAVSFLIATAYWLLPGSLQTPENQSPLFSLHTVNGAGTPVPLRDIREDWSISLGAANPTRVKGADVVSLRRSPLLLPAVTLPRVAHDLCGAEGDERWVNRG